MDKLFKTTLILLTYLLASLSFAQNSFSDNISSPAKNNRLASPDTVFLPVAQVYQVAIEIKESKLTPELVDWLKGTTFIAIDLTLALSMQRAN